MKFLKFLIITLTLAVLSGQSFSQTLQLKKTIDTFPEHVSKSGNNPQNDYCQSCIEQQSSLTSIRHSEKNPSFIEVSLISENRAQELFKKLATNEDIPFKYVADGCYARAQAMVEQLDDLGVTPAKAYVEGDLRLNGGDFGELRWQYHVAPMLMVKTDQGEVPYVFDPSLFKKAVPFSEWKALMLKNPKSKFEGEFFTSRFIYDPDTRHAKKTFYDEEDQDHAKQTNRSHARIIEMMEMDVKSVKSKKGKK